MLKRVFNGARLLTRIAELKGRLGLYAAKQAGKATIGFASAAFLAVVAVIGLHSAAYIALAPYLGSAGALAAVSVVGLGFAAVVLLISRGYARRNASSIPDKELREEITMQQERLRSMFGISDQDDGNAQTNGKFSSNGATHSEGKIDPKIIAAAGLAAAGLLGPSRIFRSLRFTAALVSTAALVNKAMHQDWNQNGNGADPPDHS
ncbi:MAG: phage holin family protein [Phycisphaeraceae bacterium]|nr:MAG: phage holin family protein [Phycisphaeraceae bacterium]